MPYVKQGSNKSNQIQHTIASEWLENDPMHSFHTV